MEVRGLIRGMILKFAMASCPSLKNWAATSVDDLELGNLLCPAKLKSSLFQSPHFPHSGGVKGILDLNFPEFRFV